MSEVKSLIAEIKSKGLLRAGDKLELLYVVAAQLQDDYAALKVGSDALAAENVALKESVDHAAGCIHAAEVEGLKDALESNDGERLADLIHRRLCHAHLPVVTPATDAYLNAVRAEGAASVGTLIRACAHEFPDSVEDIVEECAMIADNRAIILSAGETS